MFIAMVLVFALELPFPLKIQDEKQEYPTIELCWKRVGTLMRDVHNKKNMSIMSSQGLCVNSKQIKKQKGKNVSL